MAKPTSKIYLEKKNKTKIEQPEVITAELVEHMLKTHVPLLEQMGYMIPPEFEDVEILTADLQQSLPKLVIKNTPGNDFVQGLILGFTLTGIYMEIIDTEDDEEWDLGDWE